MYCTPASAPSKFLANDATQSFLTRFSNSDEIEGDLQFFEMLKTQGDEWKKEDFEIGNFASKLKQGIEKLFKQGININENSFNFERQTASLFTILAKI